MLHLFLILQLLVCDAPAMPWGHAVLYCEALNSYMVSDH